MREEASSINWRQYITRNPMKRGGRPCIRNMRIAVEDVLSYLAGGMSIEEVLSDFPELSRDDIRACFAYVADRERYVAIAS